MPSVVVVVVVVVVVTWCGRDEWDVQGSGWEVVWVWWWWIRMTKIRKGKCQHQERSTTTLINICIQAAGLRLGLLTAVLSDIVHSVMVTVEVPVT